VSEQGQTVPVTLTISKPNWTLTALGETISVGTYTATGNTARLVSDDFDDTTTATISGNSLVVKSGSDTIIFTKAN
jgi:hypothetical protein